MKQKNAKNLLVTALIAISIVMVSQIHAACEEIPYWKVIMAEAVSEGYDGMYAVACVIRNRGGKLDGFCGAKRGDLDDFCKKQGERYILMAKAIEKSIFIEKGADVTNGATHFENIKKFGQPYWAKEMTKTGEIGSHTFYKKYADKPTS